MLLIIGGRYLTFQTIYGLRTYWACGALLGASGLTLALAHSPAVVGAFTGAAIELLFSAVLFGLAKRVAASTRTSLGYKLQLCISPSCAGSLVVVVLPLNTHFGEAAM
jgi:hypothetical protein